MGNFQVVVRLLWVLSLVGGLFAGFNFFTTYTMNIGGNISAPQLAALASECLVYAIVPYVIARGFDEATRPRPTVALADTKERAAS